MSAVTYAASHMAERRDAELRAERIAKYKEERRRQLAASQQPPSQQVSSTKRYITRSTTRAKSSTPAAGGDSRLQGGPGDVSSSSEGVAVRTTRASRLRAARQDNVSATNRKSSLGVPTNGGGDKERSPVSLSTGSDASCGSSRITRPEKDKSSKRKSNLNRALNMEETPVIDANDDSSSRRRRRRVLNPNDILTSLNESGLSSGSNSTSARVTPLPSPTVAPSFTLTSPRTTSGLTIPSPRRSDLSIHMENARRGITTDTAIKSRPSSARRLYTTSSRQKSDSEKKTDSDKKSDSDKRPDSTRKTVSERKRSTASEQEEPGQSLLDRDPMKSKKSTDRRVSSSDERNAKLIKRLSGDFDKVKSASDNEQCSRKLALGDSDKNAKRVNVNSASKINDISKRMDEIAARTKETLARVQRLTTLSQSPRKDTVENRRREERASPRKETIESRRKEPDRQSPRKETETRKQDEVSSVSSRKEAIESRRKSVSKSPEKVLKPSRIANDFKPINANRDANRDANNEVVNGNVQEAVLDLDHQNHNGYHDDTKPSSILKKKSQSQEEPVVNIPPPSVHVQTPVSILKRKSFQDEAGSSGSTSSSFATPPVTFSPTVVDHRSNRNKKPGILKKRCSLDESHVIRRRSYSPDVALVEGSNDYRPILKNQRRSSLEEIIRTRSPDSHLPGILKRKHSRGEDEFGDRSLGSPEPQSILKRKSGTSSSGSSGNSPHVSIATAVILAAAGGAEIILEPSETVKPILKKKSFSDENPCMDTLNPEVPKPILKKKSSTETDDQDDRPMKPILKSSRKCSQEDNSSWESNDYGTDSPRFPSVLRNRSNYNSAESGSECETVRPILKQSSSRENSPRPRLSFCNDDNDINILNRTSSPKSMNGCSGEGLRRPKSVRRSHTVADADLSSIINLRRTFEDSTKDEQTKDEPHVPQRPVSVFEMIMSFEKNTSVTSSTGAIPKRSSLKGSRASGRFRTQPITFDELEATASLEAVQSFQPKVESTDKCESPSRLEQQSSPSHRDQNSSGELSHSLDLTCSTLSSSSQNNDSQLTTPSSVPNESGDSGVASKMSFAMDDDLSREEEEDKTPQELCRSNSVSAKASMFKQLEAQMKAVAEEAKAVRLSKGGNKGMQRYRNRKQTSSSTSSESRFSTQPVTLDEVQEAVRANQRSSSSDKTDEDSPPAETTNTSVNPEEPDPANLSLAERVKLFNKKITEERLPVGGGPPGGIVRKPRHARFKTQPITTEEVETAQKISPLAASLVKPPEADTLEGLSIRAAKDKIYEHAAKMLTNEVRGILKSKSAISPIPTNRPSPESEPKNLRRPSSSHSNGLHKSESSEDEGVSTEDTSSESENLRDRKSNNYKEKKLWEKDFSNEKENLKKDAREIEAKNRKNRDVLDNVHLRMGDCVKELEIKSKVRRHLEEVQQMSSSTEETPQTSDGESSGGREVKRIIGNEAVARRRQAAINRQKEKNSTQLIKSKSQSSISREPPVSRTAGQAKSAYFETSSVTTTDDVTAATVGFVRGGVRRSLTLPLRPASAASGDMPGGGTIADRLAELQNSGNNEWRKRLPKLNTANDELIQLNSIVSKNLYNDSLSAEPVSVEKTSTTPTSILAARKDKLDAASQQWKKRVEVSDAVSFSVAGRMHQEAKELSVSPLAAATIGDKKKRTPKATRFRSKDVEAKPPVSTPVSPQKELQIRFKRSVSAPGVGDEENDSDWEGSVAKSEGRRVVVTRPDDETFSTFFESVTKTSHSHNEQLQVTEQDLDSVTSHSAGLLVTKRTVRVHRRHAATHRNPIKALAARPDIREEYTEVITGVAEREKRRLNVEKLAKHSSMAIEALAGLASKEDFTAISLKKGTTNSNSSLLPYKDLMLLHIKGRRHVQTRLVEPVASSINRGDNYVLVTPTQVYNYVGLYSNIIEQSRGSEIAQHIQQKKDLGCKCNEVITIHETKGKNTKSQVETFWKLLGSVPDEPVIEAGHPDEDEIYESAMIDTNMVYSLEDDELVPIDAYWGAIPKIEMLDSSKVLVFDFGSEMYIWSGRNVPLEQRKIALKLAKELWESGYNYSECAVCPVNAVSLLGDRKNVTVDKKATSRPDWALICKITQHGETILFREKFLDWPDFSRVIKVKNNNEKSVDGSIVVKPCDACAMRKPNLYKPDLILEGSHLRRGIEFFDDESSRHFEITTLGVTAWHVLEYEYEQLPKESVGQFFCGDSYVIRWQYMITVTGRELSGKPSKHSMLGRDRCAYFCWQGKDAPLNEKGAAALLTVELDHERGPQIRVTQGAEPPAFLNLFNGTMTVHMGRRESLESAEKRKSPWRLYMIRGEIENEVHLIEVPCSMRQLRSRSSLILLNTDNGSITIWHGSKSLKHTRSLALSAAKKVKVNRPVEYGLADEISVFEAEEGEENKEIREALGSGGRQLYMSLAKSPNNYEHTPRLFHLSSVSGVFKANEIHCPHQSDEITPYPFIQSDLYSANQPALFLIDNGHELWLWQGWWPEVDSDSDSDSDRSHSDQTGSGQHRWQAERRAAMQTTLDYWQGSTEKPVPAYLVWAGLEPLEFTNLFPTWTDRDDIAELNIKDGRKPGEILRVENELARLTQSTYPLVQLLQRPLPEGVDPTHLEDYLSSEDFVLLLGMTKPDFQKLPTWKQTNIKKENGLF